MSEGACVWWQIGFTGQEKQLKVMDVRKERD